MAFQLTSAQEHQLSDIATRYQLVLLYLFGSVARNDYTQNSDCDLAYSTRQPLSLQQQYALQEELQQILNIAQPIDLVNLVHATPLLAYQIIREGMPLYALPDVEESFYQRTIKNYIDAKPLFQATQQYIQAYVHQ